MSPAPRLLERWFAWLMARVSDRYNARFGAAKAELFADLRGTVLEIGPGTGPNLVYIPAGVHWIGVEPNRAMHAYLRAEAERMGREIELRAGRAERLDVDDASVDAVISTLVLCSVPDLDDTLEEVYRVLRPGGRFLFLEHVAAEPGTMLRKAQALVDPLWRRVNDNCHLTRETAEAIARAGFVDLAYEKVRGPLPIPLLRPHILGSARKPHA